MNKSSETSKSTSSTVKNAKGSNNSKKRTKKVQGTPVQEALNAIQPPLDAQVASNEGEKSKLEKRGRRPNNEIEGRGQVVKKHNRTLINPDNIVVDWDNKSLGSNPRMNYSRNKSEWKLFVDSIRDNGIQQNIKLYLGADDKWHLRHGFRRFKAVQQLKEEGLVVELVPFDEVSDNEEEALVDHFDLNNGKPLTDIEAAEGLRRLRQLTGQKNVAELARRVHIPYIKAVNLLNFADKAATQVKKAVVDGNLSFAVAKNIVSASKNTTEQVKLLKEGQEHAKSTGKNKIRIKNIAKVKEAKLPLDKKLLEILDEAEHVEGMDIDFLNKVKSFVSAIQDGKSSKEVLDILSEVHA